MTISVYPAPLAGHLNALGGDVTSVALVPGQETGVWRLRAVGTFCAKAGAEIAVVARQSECLSPESCDSSSKAPLDQYVGMTTEDLDKVKHPKSDDELLGDRCFMRRVRPQRQHRGRARSSRPEKCS